MYLDSNKISETFFGVGFAYWDFTYHLAQRAKKVVSNSPGLVDFAIGLVNSVLTCPTGK